MAAGVEGNGKVLGRARPTSGKAEFVERRPHMNLTVVRGAEASSISDLDAALADEATGSTRLSVPVNTFRKGAACTNQSRGKSNS